ncbi:hypothetical protein [Flavitalea sp.]|nr:hypothetical protein [Flavitalea sp.]
MEILTNAQDGINSIVAKEPEASITKYAFGQLAADSLNGGLITMIAADPQAGSHRRWPNRKFTRVVDSLKAVGFFNGLPRLNFFRIAIDTRSLSIFLIYHFY